MDRFELLSAVAGAAMIGVDSDGDNDNSPPGETPAQEAAEPKMCPSCGYIGTMKKPSKAKKKKVMSAGAYSDSYSNRRTDLNEAISQRYPSKDTYVYISDFGADWAVYGVSGHNMDTTEYWQCPYSVMDNGEVSLGAAFEVEQTWAPVA